MVGQTIKPGFKKTEIGEIPEEWKLKPLEQLCEIYDNERIPLSDKIRKNRKGFFPYCGANGIVDYIDDYLFDGEFVLLAEDGGYYGKSEPSAYLMKGKFWVNNHAHVLRGIQDEMENGFLLNSLIYLDIARYIFGTTRLKLNQQVMRSILLAVPNFNEQQKIAKILSNTDSLIESLDKLISKKRNIKQGLMQTLLTRGIGHTKFKKTEIGEIPEEWGTAKASDIYYIVTGTTPSTAAKEYWDQGKIEWFTPKDLRYVGASFSIFTSERKITEKAMTENSLTLLPLNSIVLSTRAPVGYVGINTKEATFNQGCKGLVPKQPEIVDTRFHAFYISRISNLLNTLSGGSTFKELSKETLGNITLPLPENGEQQKIAKILSDADKEIEVLEQKRYKYEMLKTGMMQQLLTGRIRVK